MPVATHQIPYGARVLVFTCDGCGEAAMFGADCDVLAAVRTGDVRKAGHWFCGRHHDGSLYCKQENAA
jgi:hypothetical protein